MSLFARKTLISCPKSSLSLTPSLVTTQHRFKGGFTPADMPIIKRKWVAATKVGKICESMKNIAAGALPIAERHLARARPFGAVTLPIFQVETEPSDLKRILHIAIGTERGMCGALSSNTVRQANDHYSRSKPDRFGHGAVAPDEVHKVVTLGKRSAAVSNTLFGRNMLRCAGEVKTRVPTFEFCCHVTEYILYESEFDWDKIVIHYNEYENAVRSVLREINIYKSDISAAIAELQFPSYEVEADETRIIENLIEFKLASTIYMVMAENAASEQGSRLRSMDSAFKNCLEKQDEYEKIYQGLRKTKITNELIILASAAKMATMKRSK